MNDRRTIVALAIAIAIAFSCPGGSPMGCAALTVPIIETLPTEVSIPTAGITNDDPWGPVVQNAVAVARSLLAGTEIQFERYLNRALWLLKDIVPSNDSDGNNRRRRWAIESSESDSWLDQLTDLKLPDAPNLLGDLVTSIPKIITHPLEFASNVTSTVEELTVNATGIVAQSGFNLLWRLLTTQVLPWLHTTLDRLDQTNSLPPSFHNFVQNFDTFYNLAKLLGYVN